MNFYYKNINIKTFIVRRLRRLGLFNYLFPLGTGGSSDYSFRVWIRHIEKLRAFGYSQMPNTVAELGPGSSLGAGIAALLSGVNEYNALDIQNYVNKGRLLNDFESMLTIFKKRHCEGIKFPHHILTEDILSKSLEESRINSIRNSIIADGSNSEYIKYYAPWTDEQLIVFESVDYIFSQCVLEHVDALEECYIAMYKWLKKNGYSSHLVDFKCHDFTKHWNGHWAYSTKNWNTIKGTSDWAINRLPASKHHEFAVNAGFQIINFYRRFATTKGIDREKLCFEFSFIPEEDLKTSSIDILLRKN